MRRLLLLAVLAFLPTVGAAGDTVLIVEVDGVVTRGTALHIREAIEHAESLDAPVVIRLETPGGLVDATLDIHKDILRAKIPVLTYVGPRGAEAASAGTFMFLMGHPNGMAPETQIGSAQPIQSTPTGETTNATAKVENFLVERMRQIAERANRNATLATRFITENLNMGDEEAEATGLSDATSEDIGTFIRQVHGWEAIVGSGTVTLDTWNADIVVFEKSLLAKTIDVLGNPQLSFLFLMVGAYALIFGLANPGTYVPETVGALLVVMGIVGLGLFSVSAAGVLLLAVGLAFLVAEVFTPTQGILTAAGVVALLLAVIFLVREPLLPAQSLRQFTIVGYTMALVSGAAVAGAVALAVRTKDKPIYEFGLAGETGHAATALTPGGQVNIRGEVWRATLRAGDAAAGDTVRVVARDGLHLTVEALDDSEE